MRLFPPLQNAVNAVIAELRRIRDALQKQGERHDEQGATQQKHEPTQVSVNAVLHIPETIVTKYDAAATQAGIREDRKLFWERATFWAVLAYTTVAALQGYVTYKTLGEIKKQTEASQCAAINAANAVVIAAKGLQQSQSQFTETLKQMKDQTAKQGTSADAARTAANVADKTLTITERPWLAIEGSIDTPAPGTVDIITAIKNFGSVPAIDVAFDFFPVYSGESVKRESILKACDNSWDRTSKGIYIIPGSSFTYSPRTSVRRFQGGDPLPPEKTAPILAGCIVYFGQFGEPHHTEFCLHPVRRKPDKLTFEPCHDTPLKAD